MPKPDTLIDQVIAANDAIQTREQAEDHIVSTVFDMGSARKAAEHFDCMTSTIRYHMKRRGFAYGYHFVDDEKVLSAWADTDGDNKAAADLLGVSESYVSEVLNHQMKQIMVNHE